MKIVKLSTFCLVACTAIFAQAGDYGSWAMATVYGYSGGMAGRPMVVNNFTPPYFSMHPPVYYGERYYRPYGDSPYASWPQLQANSNYMPRQQNLNQGVTIVDNPFCVQPQIAPAFQAPSIQAPQIGTPAATPEAVQPQSEQPKTEKAPAPSGKSPDVVKTGRLEIENPFFREPAQYIRAAESTNKHF